GRNRIVTRDEEKRTLSPNDRVDAREESNRGVTVSVDVAALPFQIRLFGPFEVSVSGRPLPRLRLRKSQALLALLALRGGAAWERDWLLGLLWPEQKGAQALRNCLSLLRQALGPAAARLASPTFRTLTLDLSDAFVDVLAFDAALAR